MAKTGKIRRGNERGKVSFLMVFTIVVVSLSVLFWADIWDEYDAGRRAIYVITDLKYMLDVPDSEKQACMDWAYGVGWEWCLTGDLDERWNDRHWVWDAKYMVWKGEDFFRCDALDRYLFEVDGTDSPYDTQKRISKYWNTIGGE